MYVLSPQASRSKLFCCRIIDVIFLHSPEFQRWCCGHPPEPSGPCWPSFGRGTFWETWCCISGCHHRPPTATLPDAGSRGNRHKCTSPFDLSCMLWQVHGSVLQRTQPAGMQSPWKLWQRDQGRWKKRKKYLKLHFFKALDAKAIGAPKHLLWKNKIYDKMLFASPINLLSQNVYRGLDALSGFTTTSAILQVFLRRNSSPDISFWFCTVICFTQSHHHGIFWSN